MFKGNWISVVESNIHVHIASIAKLKSHAHVYASGPVKYVWHFIHRCGRRINRRMTKKEKQTEEKWLS